MPIPLRTNAEMDEIAGAGRVLDSVLSLATDSCRPGMTTLELSHVVERAVRDGGAEPILSTYPGKAGPFGHACCICVNEEVVHSPPRGRIIRPGDVVTIDAALRHPPLERGWFVDAARSIAVPGDAEGRAAVLVDAADSCVAFALAGVSPGVRWSECARAAREAAAAKGLCLAEEYNGHGIGRALHEQPTVAFGAGSAKDFTIRTGMVFTIEPIVLEGTSPPEFITLDDGWTVLPKDRRWSAHREITVGVAAAGVRILAGGDPRVYGPDPAGGAG